MSGKNLVPPRISPPKWRKDTEKKSMSVLIGIICPEAIVVATDSHVTEVCNGTFDSVDKITVVHFWVDEVLIAQAGLWSLTNRIVETIKKKARNVRITEPETVTKIVEDAIRESKQPLNEEQEKYINENPSALLLAFYVGKIPYLYTVEIKGSGISTATAAHFTSAGIGSYLADYILGEYATPHSHSDIAIATSIFVIKKVKENTKYCGGDTIIKRMVALPNFVDLDKQHIGKSEKIGQDFVDMTEKKLVTLYEKATKSLHKQLLPILQQVGAKLWAKHQKEMQDLENGDPSEQDDGLPPI